MNVQPMVKAKSLHAETLKNLLEKSQGIHDA